MSVSPTYVYRRNLPHWRRDGACYWITFRLADSLPHSKLVQLRHERTAWLEENPEPWTPAQVADYEARFNERVQQWLDAGYGSCALARPDVREIVRAGLTRFDGDRLQLHAAVIMPNHVHALIQPSDTDIRVCAPQSESPARMPVSPSASGLSLLLKGIKGASARAANRLLNQTGTFWMDESYDRIVRDEQEYRRFVAYIRANPRNAGLSPHQYWLHLPPPCDTGIPAGDVPAGDASANRQECRCHTDQGTLAFQPKADIHARSCSASVANESEVTASPAKVTRARA